MIEIPENLKRSLVFLCCEIVLLLKKKMCYTSTDYDFLLPKKQTKSYKY